MIYEAFLGYYWMGRLRASFLRRGRGVDGLGTCPRFCHFTILITIFPLILWRIAISGYPATSDMSV